MFRGVGDDGEQDVPEALFEIEVETEMSPAEVEGGCESEISTGNSRPHSPVPKLPIIRAPFSNARAFGEWLFDVMDTDKFLHLTALFAVYYRTIRMTSLYRVVKYAKIAFRRNQTFLLYFLEGLSLVAVSWTQKQFINRLHHVQLQKILPREE